MRNLALKLFFLWFCLSSTALLAQDNAVQILQKVDDILGAPQDQELLIKLTIVDRRGNESYRELTVLQKGSDKRMVRFLAPADQKGIAFLSLPGGNLTMYMPAYGRTRRIAGHVRNTNFAGTDYTYEDMEAKNFLDKYEPSLFRDETDFYVLELTPKEDVRSDYAKLYVTIRKSDNYPLRIDYFDRRGNNVKRMSSSDIREENGYLVAFKTVMEDLRGGSKSIMEIKQARFDSKLSDDIFTERFLTR